MAKNEAQNIVATVQAVRALGVPVIVLDSGSTDATPALAKEAGATVESYTYEGHASAYNEISTKRTAQGDVALVLDADMRVSQGLVDEALRLAEAGAQVVSAPIEMWWAGERLAHGSLCPPKAFLLAGGAAHFEAIGHGERVRSGSSTATTSTGLVHDDRKPYESYLLTQLRYARALTVRAAEGKLTWRDRIRQRWPWGVLAAPWVSYFWRGGVWAGRAGQLYALDRLIAEAIVFREQVAAKSRGVPR
ncbi:MAG: glycosyltransferase [Myxococcaceae bacterium]